MGIMSLQEAQVATVGALMRSILDAKRQPRRAFDCGRSLEGFVIDLRRKLLLIPGKCRR